MDISKLSNREKIWLSLILYAIEYGVDERVEKHKTKLNEFIKNIQMKNNSPPL